MQSFSIDENTNGICDNVLENEISSDEESLASRIRKLGNIWYNNFRYVEMKIVFSESVGPIEFVTEQLIDPFSAFKKFFPDEIINNLVYKTNLYVMQNKCINHKTVTFERLNHFWILIN